ncbi:Hypothetical predicted protein, partial [Pelobates cultripes]
MGTVAHENSSNRIPIPIFEQGPESTNSYFRQSQEGAVMVADRSKHQLRISSGNNPLDDINRRLSV